MLVPRRDIIAGELAAGTGAAIAVRSFEIGRRKGLRMWFDDLGERRGPVAEIKPLGLKSHEVRLSLGSFSGSVLTQIANAEPEELLLARSLFKSVAAVSEFSVTNQSLEFWKADKTSFEAVSVFRHQHIFSDSDEAVTVTSREVIVPLMAAMAELIGYDVIEDSSASYVSTIEGAASQGVVTRRERNPRNRLLCLRIHGKTCKVCSLQPDVVYGTAGDIIEVHHLEPVSMIAAPKPYDPETDLVPLCPNCHRAVHSRRPWPLTLEELTSQMGCRNV
jgi:5-methylcytosine-specific restriction protein A